MSAMPTQKPGRSKQDYETPQELMDAIEFRFGKMDVDLAASRHNSKANFCLTEWDDSFSRDWNEFAGNLWLNPPYAKIGKWAEKCCATDTFGWRSIYLLVPAAVGSDWYRHYVEPYAYVLALSPRVTFVGCKDPYIKDLILAVYSRGLTGFKTWRWK